MPLHKTILRGYVETMSFSNQNLKNYSVYLIPKLKIKKIIFFYAFFFEKFLKKIKKVFCVFKNEKVPKWLEY